MQEGNKKTNRVIYLFILLIGRIKLYVKKKFFKDIIEKSALILPPSSPGSLGDDSLVIGLKNLLQVNYIKHFGILSYQNNDDWSHIDINFHVSKQTIFYKSNLQFIKLVWFISSFSRCFVIGADTLDGKYSENRSNKRFQVANISRKIGLETSIISFSFNSDSNESIMDSIINLDKRVELIARDPLSKLRFEEVAKRSVDLSADLSFLMKPNQNSKKVLTVGKWIENQRLENRLLIGINLNRQVLDDVELNLDNLIFSYSKTIKKFFDEKDNISLLLLPHDFRGPLNDYELASLLIKTLPNKIKQHLLIPDLPLSAPEIKAICGYLDIALTGRMHVAIHCLSQGIPVACISYQDKVEGLFDHFDLRNVVISSRDALNYNCLYKFLKSVISRKDDIKLHILQKLPEIVELANKNVLSTGN